MRTPKKVSEPAASPSENRTDSDRFPTAKEGLQKILEYGDLPDGQIDRMHIQWLASGECIWKIRPARAEEDEGGYLYQD